MHYKSNRTTEEVNIINQNALEETINEKLTIQTVMDISNVAYII